jgi:hypothetical protein
MTTRKILTVVPLVAALALAGCTSSSKSTPKKASSGSPAASTASPAAAALAAKLQAGLATAKTVHLAISTKLAGQAITGSGVAQLDDGTITAGDVTEQLPSPFGAVRIIVSGGKTYAQLPAKLAKTGKPWVVVSANSSNAIVAGLGGVVATVIAVGSPESLIAFTRAAKSVKDLGAATIGGVATTHYALVVDHSLLPADLASSVTSGKAATIPVDLYIDAQGRPVQVGGTFTIAGQTVTPTITLTGYNAPLTITAPPADQVGTI